MTGDECRRLEIALLFLELIIDISEHKDDGVAELGWAAHSYIQSVSLEAVLPDEEAQELYAKLQAAHTITEAKRSN